MTMLARLNETLQQVKARACAAHGLDPEHVLLWDFFLDSKYVLLEDQLCCTLGELQMQDGQPLLLEQRQTAQQEQGRPCSSSTTLQLEVHCAAAGSSAQQLDTISIAAQPWELLQVVKQRACAAFGVDAEVVLLWDYFEACRFMLLEDQLQLSLQQARLGDGQHLLLDPVRQQATRLSSGKDLSGSRSRSNFSRLASHIQGLKLTAQMRPPCDALACSVTSVAAGGFSAKCPTEVRLSTAPPTVAGASWYCPFKLRREYSKDNKQLETAPKELAFKALNQDQKDQLHHYIAATQRALLNPSDPLETYVGTADRAARVAAADADSSPTASTDGVTGSTFTYSMAAWVGVGELQFTGNVVVLEITGADVDLALIDLPGIIQTEPADNGSNVELVQALVRRYISNSRFIIVAIITCKDDIDNQLVVQLAREADKEGRRTIGVLTKADMIELGTHDTWLPVLQGESYLLRLRYYVVVNPSPKDISNNMSAAEAADKEAHFFDSDAFFSSDSRLKTTVRERFGVGALRQQLSRQLVALTQRELPGMKHALEQGLAQLNAQQQQLLPPPSANASEELFRRLRALSDSVQGAVAGRDDDVAFFRAADTHYSAFKSAVMRARPQVQLPGKHGSSAAQEDDSEDDSEVRVRELAQKYRRDELPKFLPYKVVQALVQPLKGRWDAAAQTCLRDVAKELQELTGRLVQQHFGQFARAEAHIRGLLYEVLQALKQDTLQRVDHLMAMEREDTWTQNDRYFTDSMQRFLDMLTERMYGDSSDTDNTN
ncbi:hypothetical protein OEZ86_009573 [Tetradesmus obliquus]|uniref:Dynamin GTPase domain-containing protein n=1 Tax=Tetradesmus obliquus TaxID=3088 RepID=A0ABY8UM23_TETOB|nr:hypothetical protein OEZ85_001018 [Tetradesmus obliquus]WIA43042.1 hypothetical protein OEZ86_009573 [Tetradesmus obliquus]